MYIKKRDGRIVDFDFQRIIDAIIKAMSETPKGIDEQLAGNLATEVELELFDEELPTVEEIQDLVEMKLMESERKDVAKAYILYRNTRKNIKKNDNFTLLEDAFISKYKHMPSNMEPLGDFVYHRTYSRFLQEEGRREFWWETARRAVEYNCSLVPTSKEEAQKLFDNVFNLRQFLSGRTFWVGGTPVAKEYPMSNFNCFRGDTEFLTSDGIRTFEQLGDGQEVEVLNGNGAWSKSKVKKFGKQEVVKLTVRRKNTRYTEDIYTTENHIWFVDRHNAKRYDKIETKDLKKGDILRKKVRYEHQQLNMCPTGIKHGIVYGDGSFDRKKGHCRISLIGKKQELVKYFSDYPTCSEGKRDSTLVYGLPYYFKKLPAIHANPEYLKGFIYGLLLTDGRIDSSIRLDQKDESAVRKLQSMCELIGLTTSKVKENIRANKNFGEQYSNTWGFTIHKESLIKHNLFFEESLSPDWVVESIKFTGKVESVWCVVEPKTHSFTLRGGIHTHNCAYQTIDNVEAFSELLYLLMLGSGVGVRIKKDDIKNIRKFRTNYKLYHKYFKPVEKDKRAQNTSLIFEDEIARVVVGDSKNGWSDAMKFFLSLITDRQYKNVKNIIIDYDNVRPMGEKLKTFGGTASGHGALKDMFSKIDNLLSKQNEEWYQLKPIDALDICNIIGEGVVVGGVRRTAEIVLFDSDDQECIDAKTNLYKEVEGQWIVDNNIIHRSMSNNSIWYTEKPSREKLHWQMEKMRYSGEPAFVNEEAGRKRRDNFNGVNPCAEILLDSKGMCNLTTVNVMSFVEEESLDVGTFDEPSKKLTQNTLNKKKLFEAQRLSARAGYRMTCVELELPGWNRVQQRDKLVGCSLTGWQDMVNAVKLSKSQQEKLLRELRMVAQIAVEEYAIALGQNVPLLVTTVKPEGTLSQLPTVSSGVHFSHSPYYIRRVRVNAKDPLVKVCEELGYPVLPEVGQDWETCKTKVVEFPVKAPKGKTKYDVSAIEQLEIYKMFMEHYVDHNASITVHVRDDEWDDVEQWMWDNWDDVVAVSFLPLSDSFYALLPYEAISEEEYLERKQKMKPFVPSLLSKYETDSPVEDDLNDGSGDCATGACPIR